MNKLLFDINKPNGLKHFQDQLNVLMNYNADKDEEYYNDIHIYQEDSFIVLEWDHVPYSHDWGGQFKYVDWDEVVMKEVNFPDNHYEYLFPDEVDERLKEWHSLNPEWVKTSYGTWTNKKENELFKKYLEGNSND